MHDRDAAKRIPKSIGTDAKLFGTYTLVDAAVALFPAVVVVLLTQALVPTRTLPGGYAVQSVTIPVAVVAIAIGTLFVYLTPAHLTSVAWIASLLGYWRSETEIAHEDAKQYTQIEQIHPDRGAIERTDGAFVGMVQVEPPTMALATDEEWKHKAESFEEFLNTAVDFPIQIYSTTQTFPVEEYLSHYTDRLSDPDVQANPQLAALIEHYVDWYAGELDERRMTIRDHYVIVRVTPDEVHFDHNSLVDKLSDLPVLGLCLRVWLAPRVEDQRKAMSETLTERLRRIETGLREIEGCTATQVDVDDATRLVGDFWTGDQFTYDDLSVALRTDQIVRSDRRAGNGT